MRPSRPRGRPATATPEHRRAVIVDAAYAAFVELGLAATTTEIVAARARASKRTIYELFANKTELFAAVVQSRIHLLLDLPRPAGERLPVLETLIRIFRLDMDRQRDIEREALLHLILREATLDLELSDLLYDRKIIRSRELLMSWLEAEAARGTLAVEDAAVCAGMLMDIAFGALLPRRRQPGDAARDARKEDIKRRFEIVLRGLRPTGEPPRGRDGAEAGR